MDRTFMRLPTRRKRPSCIIRATVRGTMPRIFDATCCEQISPYSTEAELRTLIEKYIDQYNNLRPHEALDYATPASIYNASFAA